MHSKDEAEECLRQMLNNPQATFKPGQWEAIDAVVNHRKKLIVVEKTGWGKSAVYFIATSFNRHDERGMTIVISPLISLMRNQMLNAENVGLKCQFMNSSNFSSWNEIKRQVLNNQIDILLIAPERLANPKFMEQTLLPMADKIALFVVDEVHCISDWGHDFRPDYKRISEVLQHLPANTPIIGTTATANERVIKDIEEQFGEGCVIQRGPLTRESLRLDTVDLPDRASRLVWLAKNIKNLEGSGIIYVLTEEDADCVAAWLYRHGYPALPYYGNVEVRHHSVQKSVVEERLLNNTLKAVVATSALGMGFDKPDIRFVIHFQVPGNVIAYYQQVGRAGRGVSDACGILLAGREDAAIHEYFRKSAFASEEDIRTVLHVLENAEASMPEELIAEKCNLSEALIVKILKYLWTLPTPPVTKVEKGWVRLDAVDYVHDREKIKQLTKLREEEWEQMEEYVRTPVCKMQFLAGALDNKIPRCGKCSSCLNRHIFTTAISEAERKEASDYLNTRYKEFLPVSNLAHHRFLHYPYLSGQKMLPTRYAHQKGYILCHWGQNKLGELVAEDKHRGCFSDVLVDAFVQMLQDKFVVKAVRWVTCVPSMRHPGLVPDFAKRVAAKLGLPFYDVIKKVRDNQQQKGQQNTAHRLQNLDGVFQAEYIPTRAPVLLIDDIYDSGWTLTLLSAILMHDGVCAVYPATLSCATSK